MEEEGGGGGGGGGKGDCRKIYGRSHSFAAMNGAGSHIFIPSLLLNK